jgi:hypothetical protein
VYPALHSVVEVCYPIGGEEHRSLKVFQFAEEDRDKGIVLVTLRPSAEKCISLVKEQQGIPMIDNLKRCCQLLFEDCRVMTKVGRRYLED